MSANLASLFFTTQAKPGTGAGVITALQGQLLGGSNSGVFAAPGAAFFDLLLGGKADLSSALSATAEKSGDADKNTTEIFLPSGDNLEDVLFNLAALSESNPQRAAVLQKVIAASGDDAALEDYSLTQADIAALIASALIANQGTNETNAPTQVSLLQKESTAPITMKKQAPPEALSQIRKKVIAYLEGLLTGLPEENKFLAVAPNDSAIKKDGVPSSHATPPALIATGLSPEQLTALVERIKKRTDENSNTGIEALAIPVKILPPPAARSAVIAPRTIITAQPKPGQQPLQAPKNDGFVPAAGSDQPSHTDNTAPKTLSAQLNALSIGEDILAAQGDSVEGRSGFENLLKVIEQAQKGAADTAKNTTAKNAANSPGLSTVANHTLPALGMAFSSAHSSAVFPDGRDWAHHFDMATGQSHGLSLNGPALMTSLSGNAAQASQPHPATQIVATAISKAAADGQPKSFTLRLEPPELGRIEVRMEFSKDKTLKTHMLVEKQETYLMLQRDSHVLERALQNAGLDADGSGISFELSQDGNLFNHHQDGRGGSNDSGGGSSGGGNADTAEGIIETTIDWALDPLTGHTRYSLLA